jgi:hypothetical protein
MVVFGIFSPSPKTLTNNQHTIIVAGIKEQGRPAASRSYHFMLSKPGTDVPGRETPQGPGIGPAFGDNDMISFN